MAMRRPVSAWISAGSSSSPACSAARVWSAAKRCSQQIVIASSARSRRQGVSQGLRTDASEDARERQVLAQRAHGGGIVAFGDVTDEVGDLDVRGARVAARRRAVRVVIAELQFEVELPDRAQRLSVRADDHPVRDDRVAGSDRVGLALELDDAQAAGRDGVQPVVLAEGGDVDAGRPSGLKDGGAGLSGDGPAVDGEIHARLLGARFHTCSSTQCTCSRRDGSRRRKPPARSHLVALPDDARSSAFLPLQGEGAVIGEFRTRQVVRLPVSRRCQMPGTADGREPKVIVIPRPLEGFFYERLTSRYADRADVRVIVDRRVGERRAGRWSGGAGPSQRSPAQRPAQSPT